ncbi:MAG TPA: hypothetical protein VH299_01695 [Solirubrobacterales bacterium]|jgi:hypothetical protein|nr:hypothetical protein [Solirubrobacterales bacterium]
MSEDGAPPADGAEAPGAARTWTNVYVQFSLPRQDQQTLEDLLFERGSSLGEEFRRALEARLLEAGIDPAALERPELDDDHDHHH